MLIINKYRFQIFVLILSAWLMGFGSCTTEKKQFTETESGLIYIFHLQNQDSSKVNRYDVVDVLMNYRTSDTVLFEGGKNPISFQIDPIVEGDLLEGIMLMRKGDSATFGITPEKFFINMMQYRELPVHVKGKDILFFDIKVVGINPEPAGLRANRLEKETRKAEEPSKIARYLEENHITIPPTESGLYFVEIEGGKGTNAVSGKLVSVHFRGFFLDGRAFDSSYERGQPVTFILGRGEVIPGWDEAIALMSEGGKAKLILPASLAYKDQHRGNIKPYTPLIFEIELLNVGDRN
jgi:FKBP-type peptidyl-prolyl cis-trans isomerase FkpA